MFSELNLFVISNIISSWIFCIKRFFYFLFIRFITKDTIPEEPFSTSSLRRPSWFSPSTTNKRRPSLQKQQTLGISLMDHVSSPSPSPSDSSADEDIDCLMKAGFWYQKKLSKGNYHCHFCDIVFIAIYIQTFRKS